MIPRTAEEVLDAQAALAKRLISPAHYDVTWIAGYMYEKERTGAHVATMFYPVLGGDGVISSEDENKRLPVTVEAGAKYAKIMGSMVGRATCFQVTAEMMDVIQQATPEAAGKIARMEAAEMPCATGFVWLDKPWIIRDRNHKDVPVRAVSWDYINIWTVGGPDDLFSPEGGQRGEFRSRGDESRPMPAFRLVLWSHLDDDIVYNRVEYEGERYDDMLRRCGPLTTMHATVIPFGLEFLQVRDEEENSTVDDVLAVVHLLWMFLTMEVLVEHRAAPIGRAFRRRALKSLKHDTVQVITLRRPKHDPDEEREHRYVDWTCRWIVQGHSRHLEEYEGPHHEAVVLTLDKRCAVCGTMTTFVRPYVKGPEGLPLRVKDTRKIMRLAR